MNGKKVRVGYAHLRGEWGFVYVISLVDQS